MYSRLSSVVSDQPDKRGTIVKQYADVAWWVSLASLVRSLLWRALPWADLRCSTRLVQFQKTSSLLAPKWTQSPGVIHMRDLKKAKS